jgi:hypothetical protein
MESNRFKIIFDRVKADTAEPSEPEASLNDIEAIKIEADAVAELREIVLETIEPASKFYTST